MEEAVPRFYQEADKDTVKLCIWHVVQLAQLARDGKREEIPIAWKFVNSESRCDRCKKYPSGLHDDENCECTKDTEEA